MDENKFVYHSSGEFQILKCQCEVCQFYNNGDFSTSCPKDNIEDIRNNKMSCPNKKIKSLLD